jgi:hypothetical protein
MKSKLLCALFLAASTAAVADSVIVTETKSWKSVPVVIDEKAHTYTIQGTVPEGEFYYTYPGYRCITEKRDVAGVDILMFHANVSGGTDIYCYPE